MRLIDADALIEFCAERWIPLNIDAVNMQPTIQPEKAQHFSEGTTKDTISRKPAIDALDKQIKQCCKALGSLSLSDVDTHAVKVEMASLRAYREMLENLPTAQPEPQWISCRNDLPDIGMTVLFCDIDGDEFIGHRASDYWWSVDDKVKSVIAWMPLPKPFKGGINEIN